MYIHKKFLRKVAFILIKFNTLTGSRQQAAILFDKPCFIS